LTSGVSHLYGAGMQRKPSQIVVVPPAIENLRTLFKKASGDLNLNLPKLENMLRENLDIKWPYKELRRFMIGETKRIKRPLDEIERMSDYLKGLLGIHHLPTATLSVPLTDGQSKLVASGLINMDELYDAVARELERQVVLLARPAGHPKGP